MTCQTEMCRKPAAETKTEGAWRRGELCVVFRGGTPSFKEVRSSWFTSEEEREAAVNHQSINMKVHRTLIFFFFFFFLSLQDGNTGLVNAQIIVYSGAEGGNVTVQCSSSSSGSRKFFCKNKCQEEDILIETTRRRARRGRYSLEWRTGSYILVTITRLTKADSGLYLCGSHASGYSPEEIEIIVIDALLDGNLSEEQTFYTRTGGNIVVACSFPSSESRKYFCKDECKEEDILVQTAYVKVDKGRYSIEYIHRGNLYVSISQLTEADSGQYRCGRDSVVFRRFRIIVTDEPASSTSAPSAPSAPSASTPATQGGTSQSDQQDTETTPTTDVWLPVGLTLAVTVVLLLLAVLIYCRRRSSKPKGPPETDRVYEDIREDRRSPDGVKTNDDYTSQNTAEHDSSALTYSELNFSNWTAASPNSAFRGRDDDVVYSAPRVEVSLTEDDPPVYSAVT